MLHGYLQRAAALKGRMSREPFIGDDAQRILIAGGFGVPLDLFGGHIVDGPFGQVMVVWSQGTRRRSDAEVADHELLIVVKQYIFWFQVAMNDLLIVRVLQRGRYLTHVASHLFGREQYSSFMAFSQTAMNGVRHHQKWRIRAIDAGIEYRHDVGMLKVKHHRLIEKLCTIF